MKVTSFIILFSVTLLCQTYAQNEPKRAKIRHLFLLTKQDSLVLKQIDASIAGSRAISASILDSSRVKLDSSLLKKHDEFMKKVISKSKENALKLINDDMVEIYDRYFTDEDIDAFRVFYESPAGKKIASSLPAINKEIMMRSTTKYQPEIIKMLTDFMSEARTILNEKYK